MGLRDLFAWPGKRNRSAPVTGAPMPGAAMAASPSSAPVATQPLMDAAPISDEEAPPSDAAEATQRLAKHLWGAPLTPSPSRDAHLDAVRALVEQHGADVNAPLGDGNAVHLFLETQQSDGGETSLALVQEWVDLLTSLGADYSVHNAHGATTLHTALINHRHPLSVEAFATLVRANPGCLDEPFPKGTIIGTPMEYLKRVERNAMFANHPFSKTLNQELRLLTVAKDLHTADVVQQAMEATAPAAGPAPPRRRM